ncbi:MAG: hypothetical protein R3A52_27525 [Polyangiales bacterium]
MLRQRRSYRQEARPACSLDTLVLEKSAPALRATVASLVEGVAASG